jgi:hypothetical protein
MTIEELNSRIFAECLHDTFTLIAPNGETVPLELIEVTDLPSPPGNEQFSVVFREIEGHRASQGTYTLEHARLGRFELFLVPIDTGKGNVALEAAFNRFCPTPGQPA